MRTHRYIRRSLVGLVAAAYLLASAQGLVARWGPSTDPRPAVELLDALTVTPETGQDSYDRAGFGPSWDTGPDGCDTRAQVLAEESIVPADIDHTDGCQVTSGRWVSLYDGAQTTDPTVLDVDHLVPLAEAWASGANTWDDQRRRAFANDLDHPDALIAVTRTANRAKGDSDPTQWLPTDPGIACWYATAWTTQKAAWDLTVDPAEHQALTNILDTCPAASNDTPAEQSRGDQPQTSTLRTRPRGVARATAPLSVGALPLQRLATKGSRTAGPALTYQRADGGERP